MAEQPDDKTVVSEQSPTHDAKPKKSANWKISLVLVAGCVSVLFATAQNRHRLRNINAIAEQQKRARMYSASAMPDEKREALEQLFDASGALVKVLAFKDEAVGLGERWTSTYEAEVEFLADCRLQESETACWTTRATLHPYPLYNLSEMPTRAFKDGKPVGDGTIRIPSNRPQDGPHVTQFKKGERKAINGILSIGGLVTTRRDGNGIWWTEGDILGKDSFLARNKIPTGSESNKPSDSTGQGARPPGK